MDGGLRRLYRIVESCMDDRIAMWRGCGGDDSMGSREQIMRRAYVVIRRQRMMLIAAFTIWGYTYVRTYVYTESFIICTYIIYLYLWCAVVQSEGYITMGVGIV